MVLVQLVYNQIIISDKMSQENLNYNEDNSVSPPKGLHIAIEGNIGAGKTTLAHQFVNYCNQYHSIKFQLHQEPVSEWKSFGLHKTNLLKLTYENPEKYSFDFQISALLTKCEQLQDFIVSKKPNILVERTIDAQKKVFIPILKLNNSVTNYQHELLIRLMSFQIENTGLKPNLIIYIRTTPEVAQQRIIKRDRIEEKDINILYLQQLHNKYEEWLQKNPAENVIIIDGDKPIEMKSLFEAIWVWAEKNNQLNSLVYSWI
jgi:deoxyadenosine/deoxycytidine kinase